MLSNVLTLGRSTTGIKIRPKKHMFVGFRDPTIPTSASWWHYICSFPSCKHRTRNQWRKFSWCHLLLGYEDCIFPLNRIVIFIQKYMEKEQSLLPNFSQLSIFRLRSEVQRLEILSQILERKWKMDHWWLIKAGKPNPFHGASRKYSSLIIDAIDLLPVHYHSQVLHSLTLTWLENP